MRPLLEAGDKIAFLNDAQGSPAVHAHVLEFSTLHGRWPARFDCDESSITINDLCLPIYNETVLISQWMESTS